MTIRRTSLRDRPEPVVPIYAKARNRGLMVRLLQVPSGEEQRGCEEKLAFGGSLHLMVPHYPSPSRLLILNSA